MNDASPRFAEGQTGAASSLSNEEGNLHLAELARHTVELNAWVTEEGLRGATAGELFDCRRWTSSSCVHTCRPRLCIEGAVQPLPRNGTPGKLLLTHQS